MSTECFKNAEGEGLRILSVYIPMPDGIRLAADIWLPEGVDENRSAPLMLEFTRYWRAVDGAEPPARALGFAKIGFAYGTVDCRGSGASFGNRFTEQSETEVLDFAHVISWATDQSWSNGKVVTIGSSFSGNTAELSMMDAPFGLRASVPQFTDFDPYINLGFPGGLLNRGFLKPWGEGVRALDCNHIDEHVHPFWHDLIGASVKPVNDDSSYDLLREAVAGHKENTALEDELLKMEFRDEMFAIISPSDSARMLSPCIVQSNVRLGQIPSYHWASFNDAGTAAGAIARFAGSVGPMRVVIGYWSHGAEFNTSPYCPMGLAGDPSVEDRRLHLTRYLDVLKDADSDERADKRLNERALYYYTAGADVWKKSDVWPPRGVEMQRWYLSESATLNPTFPASDLGRDLYDVDFEVGTGEFGRWNQMRPQIYYEGREEADGRLLTYTSGPLDHDIEITGHPVVHLDMTSSREDGAVIVYLEEVAPDGQVTMLTEGGLRLIHRKVSDEVPPYPVFGPYHTFERKDAAPVPIGEPMEIGFDLQPLSVKVKEGHALRIAIAGHDKDSFDRLPESGEVMFEVFRHRDAASFIDIPIQMNKDAVENQPVHPFY